MSAKIAKKRGIYVRLTEALYDFSIHRLNRVEVFDIVDEIIKDVLCMDEEDVQRTFGQGDAVKESESQFSRKWLLKK